MINTNESYGGPYKDTIVTNNLLMHNKQYSGRSKPEFDTALSHGSNTKRTNRNGSSEKQKTDTSHASATMLMDYPADNMPSGGRVQLAPIECK